eukprot:TRINITY_DN9967_c0_g1_i2.p3 TRINITY_DN9967_c0_g1~~TRINITY_DN9967_c0_g1_i2.p3  ORF type:complete len:100 (+),score=14.42 TRINITY_DN9967_c0_g1_i2:2-301(+)
MPPGMPPGMAPPGMAPPPGRPPPMFNDKGGQGQDGRSGRRGSTGRALARLLAWRALRVDESLVLELELTRSWRLRRQHGDSFIWWCCKQTRALYLYVWL